MIPGGQWVPHSFANFQMAAGRFCFGRRREDKVQKIPTLAKIARMRHPLGTRAAGSEISLGEGECGQVGNWE